MQGSDELAKVDKALGALTKRAYRGYYITLEVMIERYRRQMRNLLKLYVPKLMSQHGDKAHIKITVEQFVTDLHRIAEPTLTAAANVGFHRTLSDLKMHGRVTDFAEPVSAPHSIARKAIDENAKYIKKSLAPYMTKTLSSASLVGMPEAIAMIASRLDQYAHWIWRTSEQSYMLGLKEFGSFRTARRALR